MAFRKIASLALVCSVVLAAPAPQVLTSIGTGFPFGTLRAIPTTQDHHLLHDTSVRTLPSVRSQALHLNHQNGIVQQLRTVPVNSNFFSQIDQQPQIVRTLSAAPAAATVVRASPVQETLIQEEEIEVIPQDASYNFGYSVSDAVSGDAKTRQESRDGDVVRGSYSVADPDGRIRVVEYTADKEHGFQARVTYDGEEGPPAIPIDTPAATQTVAIADSSDSSSDVVVVGARDNANDEDIQVIRTANLSTGGLTRLNSPVVVRNNAQHVLHNAPVAVRSHSSHATHSSPVTLTQSGFPAATRFVQIQGGQGFGGLRAIPFSNGAQFIQI
ncbi:uncharacterized protein LOC131883874 [Tigriopus californicus]|uniref:uncharacterized protein LOC131883874 n=1 Tax=Tigriopus californicus TaxID=6832 RepID=UPI0027DA409B|nr:uncharacterized protein LOC131883874 [Tigriopus californicus]